MGEIVGKKRLAAILGFSGRSISEWARAGMPVHRVGGRGKENEYDTAEVVTWLLSRETSGGDPETIKARRRIACAEAGRREIRLSRERGEVADLRLVAEVWQRATSVFRSRMLAIPRKAVPRLRGVSGDAAKEKIIQKMIYEGLDELSKTDYSGIVHGAAKEFGYTGPPPETPGGGAPPPPAKKRGNGKEDRPQ